MIASGCEGFLDENPKSAFIGVEAYSNPKLVYINCVASLYVPRTIPNLSEFDQVLYYFDNCGGDMVITPGRRNGWVDSRFSSTISTRPSRNWPTRGIPSIPISPSATARLTR